MTELKSLHDCYRLILARANERALNYAVGYARHGLTLPNATKRSELGHEARIQALYVRTNLSGWRGGDAKAVRALMDKIIGKT